MSERIERYARWLEGLSTQELSESAERLVSVQRRSDAALIAHLAEISRRRGHLELGYASLFDYCQRCLRLAEGEVWRRTQVAGVARKFPQVLAALAEGKVSLTALSILAAHVSEENVDALLGKAERKSTREVKELVAALAPKPAVEPGIRRKPVRSREVVAEAPDGRRRCANDTKVVSRWRGRRCTTSGSRRGRSSRRSSSVWRKSSGSRARSGACRRFS